METVPLSLSLLLVCLLLSAYFSATETAFSTVNRVRVKSMATGGDRRAARVLALLEDYDRLLTAVLVGNNIVNILGASLATVLFTAWLGGAGVSVSTAVMTVVVLIFGEISPKSLAKEAPERFCLTTAGIIRGIITALTPVCWMFMQWRKLLGRLFKGQDARGMTEAELMTMVNEAQVGGGIDAHEGALIRSAIEFYDLDAADIVTPRVDIVGVPAGATRAQIAAAFRENGYSRMPVYRETMDDIVGVIHEKDFYALDENEPMEKAVKPPVFAPTTLKLSKLLRLLQSSQTHLAVVVDEFGGTEGIVTLEDVLEELVGEIYDEHDDVTEDIKTLPGGSLLIESGADLGDTLERLGLSGDYEAETVGGWVAEEMGRIPEVGESFAKQNVRVTVTKASKRRVLEVRADLNV